MKGGSMYQVPKDFINYSIEYQFFVSYHIVVWWGWSGSVVDDVELSDEKGVVKHLREFPYDYGIDHLKERETLILLKVDGTITLIT